MTHWLRIAAATGCAAVGGCATAPLAERLPRPLVGPAPASVSVSAPLAPRPPDTATTTPAASPLRQVQALAPAAPPAAPVTAGPFTLESLEELAVAVNPILRRDAAQVDAAKGQAVQAGLWSNPRFDTNNPQVISGRNTLMNVGFQQEIPVMGKKKLDQAAANENTRQQEWQFLEDRAALLTSIRTQFFAVLADQRRVEVLTELAETVKKGVDALKAKKAAGDASQADVSLAETGYYRIVGSLNSAKAILDGDRKQLAAIVGVPGLIDRPVSGTLTAGYPEFDETELMRYVGNDHTTIRNLRAVVAQNQLLARRAEVEPYPNPYLGPAYQFGVVPGNDQFWFNLQFAIPTWDRNQGNIRAAKANVVAASASIQVARNNLVNQASNQLSLYRAARAQVTEFEANILPQAREAARLFRAQLEKAGAIDLAAFLQSQQALVQASSDYVDALQALWTNAAQVAGFLQQPRFVASPPPTPPKPADKP